RVTNLNLGCFIIFIINKSASRFRVKNDFKEQYIQVFQLLQLKNMEYKQSILTYIIKEKTTYLS
ncbi:hypothetical protein, partial [Chryseobacterium sp.]|uniref:hypothetical protein n=1 Tax=Chryseobacterium sp. TaxID=1871047 RepID=UPI002FC85C48